MTKVFFRAGLIGLLGLGLVACSTQSAGPNQILSGIFGTSHPKVVSQSNMQTSVMFYNLNNAWQSGQSVNVGGVQVDTYVPIGQTKYNWTKRITVTHTRVAARTSVARYYRNVVKADFHEQCYTGNSKINILQHQDNALMYEYTMHNCGKKADQVVVGKIMRGPHSISAIDFAWKVQQPTELQRQEMHYLVGNATLMHNQM